jgi:signal transduction histidine kinase
MSFLDNHYERLRTKLPPWMFAVYHSFSLGGKRTTAGYVIALTLITSISVISYQNAVQLKQNAEQIAQTQIILQDLNALSTALQNADYGRRGYYLYQDPAELEIYQTAVQALTAQQAKLRQSFGKFPVDQQAQLEQLIGQRLALMQQSISQFQQTKTLPTAQNPLNLQIRQNRQALQQLITTLQAEAYTTSQAQLQASQQTLRSRMLIEILGTLLILLILLGVYILLYRQRVRRETAEIRQRILASITEVSAAKLQFFSMISHEFRTPLSLILGSAQLLEETLQSLVDPSQLKSLYRIQSSARQMTQLLSDVLTIARADAGALEYNPTLVELQTFCLNLLEDFQVFSEVKRAIKFSKRGGSTYAQIDERLVYSILSNLLSNALKYSPAESTVYFTLFCEPDQIRFEIRDEGIGISPQDQQHLYEPFSRGQNTQKIVGTGLGLALVKKCLDLHQGEIVLQSQVGVGTTVTITLPRTVPSHVPSQTVPSQTVPSPETGQQQQD